MNGKKRTRAWMAVMGIAFACVAARGQDVVIVANQSVVTSQINEAQLREIFTGVRSRLNDGTRTVPVLLKGGPVHEVFLHHYIRDNPEEFRTRWRKAVFTGQGSMPKEFGSEAELLDYVEATPGAIGYVSRVNEKNSVKVLRVLQ
jgi:ABC-type phosphate transport system substrate-binding protein